MTEAEPIETVVARAIDRMGAPEEPTQDVRDAYRLAREAERLMLDRDGYMHRALLAEEDGTALLARIERLQAVARAVERVHGSAWANLQPGDLGGEA